MKNIPLGEKIRQIRVSKDLTQAYMARVLDCSNTHVSRLEKGEVHCDSETLDAIKKALEIPKTTPLTEDELTVYKSQIWVWHEQLNSNRISDAQAMKDELASILHLPFERDLIVIYLMQEVQLLYMLESRIFMNDKVDIIEVIKALIEKAEALLEIMGDEASIEARHLYHKVMNVFYGRSLDYKNAIMHSIKAAECYQYSSILKPDSKLYGHIGYSYLNLGQPHYALLYSERALAADNNDPISTNWPNLRMLQASCYLALGELEKAKAIYEESFNRAKSINNKELIGITTVDLGNIEARMGRPKEAMKLFLQAEAMFDSSLNANANLLFMYIKAKCLLQMKQFKECEKVIEDGLSIAREAENELFAICLETLRHLINIKNPESQEYLEKVAIPYLRGSNSVAFYETLEICSALEKFYYKNRSKIKALNMVAVSRDILHEMQFGVRL